MAKAQANVAAQEDAPAPAGILPVAGDPRR